MKINEYVNQYGEYGPFVDNGHTNHLPMVQYAFKSLGCNDEALVALTKGYVRMNNLEKVADYTLLSSSFGANLGRKEAYGSYVTYFTEELKRSDQKVVISKTLHALQNRIGAGLFHALIRLSYAVVAENKEEIIRSLAFLACGDQEQTVKGHEIDGAVASTEFKRFIREHQGYFYLSGDTEAKESALLDALCEVFLSTGSFYVLHTITGFEALNTLKTYFEDYDGAIDSFTTSVLRWLKRVSIDEYKTRILDQGMGFDEMKNRICNITETHTIKLLYSAEVLYGRFLNEKLKRVAQVRLTDA